MKVVVILAHPREDSFNAALAAACRRGAREAGAEVVTLNLAELRFDPHLRHRSPRQQPLEPDLLEAKEAIDSADHVIFVFPTWWVTMPALLKGFLDRILLPGWAFREDEESMTGYRPLLEGRSAHLITTMDTPGWAHRWIYGRPGLKAMKQGILGFCGFRPIGSTWITGVKKMSPEERDGAIERAYRVGLDSPAARKRRRRREKVNAWFRIVRLQFYGMTMLCYGLGAGAAVQLGDKTISAWTFLAGFAGLFLLELGSVFFNEVHDLGTDRLNRHQGPFNGGSRVLPEGKLEPATVRRSARFALLGSAGLFVVLLMSLAPGHGSAWMLSAVFLFSTGFVLGPGYTVPPLRLVYRGVGEWVVSYTHSILMILAGWMLAGGRLLDPVPWTLSLPVFCAIFAAITLAGIPDARADAAVEKETIAVRFGRAAAARVAIVATFLAVVGTLLPMVMRPDVGSLYYAILPAITVHAAVQILLLLRYLKSGAPCRRIDGLLFSALSFILWFSLGPLFGLLF